MNRATNCLMDADCPHGYSSTQSVMAGMKQKARGLAGTINLWRERSRQRRELRKLADDPDLLKDVGLLNYDVLQEGGKPFWRE